jgi:DNA adenine methylase
MQTFIRCPGNKSKHINKFKKYFPSYYSCYIEPFLGSGAVFLHLQPKRWIINDTNKLLVTIWRTIKNDVESVAKFMSSSKQLIRMSVLEKKQSLQHQLETYNLTRNIKEKALIYLLLKCCFYMGYFNSNITTLDPSLVKNQIFCLSDRYPKNLTNISIMLNKTNGKIMNKDYKDILLLAKENDFVFLDPPYNENKDYQFVYDPSEKQYTVNLQELHDQCKLLDKKKVKWLMTQADTKEVRALFQDYDIHTYKVFRPASQSYKNELVIRNYETKDNNN